MKTPVGHREDTRLEEPAFNTLMLVYELLYYKLDLLLGRKPAAGVLVSQPPGSQPVYLERLQSHTYVTVEHLSHRFPSERRPPTSEPDAVIKRYHDLKLAELVSCTPDRTIDAVSHPDTPMGAALKTRWQMNRFLLKWCDHLLDQGHRRDTFHPVRAGRLKS